MTVDDGKTVFMQYVTVLEVIAERKVEDLKLIGHVKGIESVWAVIKRGFYGIFHWFSTKHTPRYIDEFVFRLNEGNCQIDRLDSLLRGMRGKRLTYAMVKMA